MASYNVRLATENDLPRIKEILKARCEWFEKNNLVGWRVDRYLRKYNDEYFKDQIIRNKLYVAEEKDVVCGLMLLKSSEEKSYWSDDLPAYYIHHLATDPKCKGVGCTLLNWAEKVAEDDGIERLRLDCYHESLFLGEYYKKSGFKNVGCGQASSYKYDLWEKLI